MEDKIEEVSIMQLVEMYDKLEEVTAKSIDLNIKQLEGRISSEDTKKELSILADIYCDLSEKIFRQTKQLKSQINSKENINQKEN